MASAETKQPSPTETTDTASVVSDDDEERLLKEDSDGENETEKQQIQQLEEQVEATSSSDSSANQSKSHNSQTRFSFYDAQEVQSKFVSTIPAEKYKDSNRKTEDQAEINKASYRYNFYDPANLPPGDANNPIKINISGSGSADNGGPGAASGGPASVSSRYEAPQRPQPLFPRTGLAAAAVPATTTTSNPSQKFPHNSSNNNSNHSHTDDILRSLQETEDQRQQLLLPASGVVLSAPPHVAYAVTSSSGVADISAAAANVPHNLTPATLAANTSILDAPKTLTTSCNSSNNNNNPYEDAIREALDLLRKHRSPPPSPSMNAIMGTTASLGGLASVPSQPGKTSPLLEEDSFHDAKQQSGDSSQQQQMTANKDKDVAASTPATAASSTPAAGDSDSLTDALQEAKLKAKQRQERMAEYASRLEEFKSSLPPEEQAQTQSQSQAAAAKYGVSAIHTLHGSALRVDHEQDQPLAAAPLHDSPPTLKPVSSIINDVDSVGLVSDISQSTQMRASWAASTQQAHTSYVQQLQQPQVQQQRVVDEEVQKGVEKVLMAILEASKSNTSSNNSHALPLDASSAVETASTHSGVSEVLLRAMDEVLHGKPTTGSSVIDPHGGTVPPTMSGISKMSAKSLESARSKRSGGERSVVDELLAEADDHHSPTRYWPREEKKTTENDPAIASSSMPTAMKTKAIFSDSTNNITVTKEETEKDIDVLIEESLVPSALGDAGEDQQEEIVSEEFEVEEDDDLNSEYDEGDSYDDENASDHENDDDDDNVCANQPKRVLGPLSSNAGGTTGVVLDVSSSNPASPDTSKESKGYFSSVVKYVTSALTPDRQRIIDNRKRAVGPQQSEDSDERSTHDIEATELMRTLCAHLLPFGVDRQANLEEVIPGWDEENPNEAGYRIIRLSKSQLRRVERAFDTMINGLKSKSQTQLNIEGEYDLNFVRELQEAERLLDAEEKRAHGGELIQNKSAKIASVQPDSAITAVKPGTDSTAKDDVKQLQPAHPDFPGIKTAGKGEMGDLEFFHLPIIFKSHVTGFEPTKDMALEPGNVVAGQYLVESELGSAAFSTAYRCIDLSSEDSDGQEEVCLKVIKNTKDFFDQSLDEIKILELLRQTGQCDENCVIRMKTFFYYREHLVIVTELLRQNLFEFGKFIVDNDEEPYFTIPRLAYLTRQCFVALRFVHKLGLVHSDIKPENILLGSYSRAKIKVIDFGSSCYLTDRQSSYIQSRSYRAPEVVLGLPYDGKIDVWSLGCVVAEMYTGEVTFQNDSIVSMLSRIEAICGSFPRHMIAQGRQSGRFFTKSGLLYEVVDDSDNESAKNSPPGPDDDDSDSETDAPIHYDIFQPKNTRLSSRLGFDADLMDDYDKNTYSGSGDVSRHELMQLFTDFVSRLLTIDPDGRPSADEALQHPWMLYAATLAEDQIKYP
ncbi:MAG: hypothetical protein SGILL_001554 [Bacillariaceae sp.]